MNKISQQKLQEIASSLNKTHMRDLFANDSTRFDKMSLDAAGLFLDYSKNLVDSNTMQALLELAEESGVADKAKQMFNGDKINFTEKRAVLHTALRNFSGSEVLVDNKDVMPEIFAERAKLAKLVDNIYNGKWLGFSGKQITDVVNIGIGGSDLGPRMVVEALEPYHTGKITCHFVSNVDGYAIEEVLKEVDPETTLFIVASKSFSTQETLLNAQTARSWLIEFYKNDTSVANHFVAISSQLDKVVEFGIDLDNCFAMWDWVGGRYSLWSNIGMSIALTIGMDNFEQLLKGAYHMDQHFISTKYDENMPVILALLGIWSSNYHGTRSQVILPYDERLEHFANYLQQADMESNGKSCDVNGNKPDYKTGVALWGGVGTNGQHAFHQLLHQGTITIPADFIIAKNPSHVLVDHHQALIANCLAQSQAMMQGKTQEEAYQELLESGMNEKDAKELAPHKVIAGNKPNNTIVMEKLTPASLGSLIALYEHKIFVQGIIWQIDSFDQWGVELGKQLSTPILKAIQSPKNNKEQFDSSTSGLLNKLI